MTPNENLDQSFKQAGRVEQAKPVSITPTDCWAEMNRERIDALEWDKHFFREEALRLQREVDRLGPEVARLEESLTRLRDALENAEANNVYATVLIGVGGFLVSYATFTEKLAEVWANLSAGLLLAGVGLLIWQFARRWRRG